MNLNNLINDMPGDWIIRTNNKNGLFQVFIIPDIEEAEIPPFYFKWKDGEFDEAKFTEMFTLYTDSTKIPLLDYSSISNAINAATESKKKEVTSSNAKAPAKTPKTLDKSNEMKFE